MTHPLVTQLRFTRSEFVRCLKGVPAEDGAPAGDWQPGLLTPADRTLWRRAMVLTVNPVSPTTRLNARASRSTGSTRICRSAHTRSD